MGPYQDVTFITQYQSIIVGLLGFGGVILTLLLNARLERKRRAASIAHDRLVIRTALVEELRTIARSFQGRIEMLEKAEVGNTEQMLVPMTTMVQVYDRLLDRLGLLSSTEVQNVMRAHLLLRELPEKLRLLNPQMPADSSGYFKLERRHFQSVKTLHVNYKGVIEEAIAALSARREHA